MLNHNNHNSRCNFSEQLISFVYGEIGEQEKSNFEGHLRNCAHCADEIAGFSVVRSSIQEWRAEDFAKLPTPVFELPLPNNQTQPSRSWFDSIRAYFSLPTIRLSAGFAAVLMAAGLFWFFSASANHMEIAGNQKETKKVDDLSLVANSEASELLMNNATDSQETLASSSKKATPAQSNPVKQINIPVNSVQPNPKNRQPIKIRNATSTNADKINAKQAARPLRKNNIPALSIEDDEDTSLRLSDILEEVGKK